jgi:hypothetical protein
MEVAALVIAGLSLLASAGLAIVQYRLQQRLGGIEEERRKEELEARLQADLTATFERRAGNFDKLDLFLVIYNRGSVGAKNVNFEILQYEEGGGAQLLAKDAFPTPVIDDRAEYAVRALGNPGWMDVKVTWTDLSGPRSKELRVSVV